jgi:hypothetical protein
MKTIIANIEIPRDPRTQKIAFIEEKPDLLNKIVDDYTWRSIMSGLNRILSRYESPSFGSFLKVVTVLPLLLSRPKRMHGEIEAYIREKNAVLEEYGVLLRHPGDNQYIELEVEMFIVS